MLAFSDQRQPFWFLHVLLVYIMLAGKILFCKFKFSNILSFLLKRTYKLFSVFCFQKVEQKSDVTNGMVNLSFYLHGNIQDSEDISKLNFSFLLELYILGTD